MSRISLIFQYEFNWNVQDPEAEKDGLFFEQTESKSEDTPDRTEGEYKVRKTTNCTVTTICIVLY